MIYNYVYDIDIRNLTFKKVNHGKQFVWTNGKQNIEMAFGETN